MKKIKNIIFDLGGVLIDWNPAYVYLEVFNGDNKKMEWFFIEGKILEKVRQFLRLKM